MRQPVTDTLGRCAGPLLAAMCTVGTILAVVLAVLGNPD